jgi:hypothetical protein
VINVAAKFATVAQSVSAMFGGPYYDAIIRSKGQPVYDDGGSIITPGTPISRVCQAQVDVATQDMRNEVGFTDGDVRILVLADTLDGGVSLDDDIELLGGAHIGTWQIQSISVDPFGIYYELRGRRA